MHHRPAEVALPNRLLVTHRHDALAVAEVLTHARHSVLDQIGHSRESLSMVLQQGCRSQGMATPFQALQRSDRRND